MRKGVAGFMGLMLAGSPMLAMAGVFDDPPPQNARPLSEILQQVENRPDFAGISEVEYDDKRYEIEYFDKNGDEQEVRFDVLTGEER